MSKVDLQVFEDLAAELGSTFSNYFLYNLSHGWVEPSEDWNFKVIYNEDCDEYSGRYENVFQLKDKTYRIWYTYTSHYGTDWDNVIDSLEEVKPRDKLITIYETI